MYLIEFTSQSLGHLKSFRKNEQKVIVAGIESQLSHEPTVETRNRKKMRPNKVAQWELRIGRFRVLYHVAEDTKVVSVEAIGVKIGSLLFIGGRSAEL